MLVKDGNLRKRIKKAQKEDKKVVKAVEELKKVGIKSLRDKEQSIEEIVMKEECIYMLEGELRGEVVYLYHDILVGGYGRR